MTWEGLNRRRFPRIIYPCMIKVVCKDGQDDIMLTHTENIGVGGVCIIVKREVKLFTPLTLEIDLLDIDDHVYAQGKVVWVVRRKAIEEVKPLFYDVGVEFTNISDRDQKHLSVAIDHMVSGGATILKPTY